MGKRHATEYNSPLVWRALVKAAGGGILGRHMKKIRITISYHHIITIENLLLAWKAFQKGKRNKKDVQLFEMHLMDNLLLLHKDLTNKTYTHGGYYAFKVNDPKPRDIHKASVRDRVVHHLLYQSLTPFYFPLFIADSYSCQDNKGVQRPSRGFRSLVTRYQKITLKQPGY